MTNARNLEDLKRINAAADQLNAEATEVLEYQALPDDLPPEACPEA